MNFTHPAQWAWLLLFLCMAAIAVLGRSAQKKSILQWFSAEGVGKVFAFERWKRISLSVALLQLVAFLFLVAALTGPQIGRKLQEIKTRGSTIMILFDCSDSMLAEDLKPTRLERSKMILSGLLERLRGSRAGIVAFAGEAYVFCPVTFDLFAAKQFLKSIEPGMIPQPGTRIGSAVRLALSKMPSGGSRALVLLTDGEDHKSDPLGAANEAKKAGVRIYSIGVGSEQGEPIPVKDASGGVTGYKKDRGGKIVLSKLDASTLAEMSRVTDGTFFQALQAEEALDDLAQKLNELEKDVLSKKQNTYEDRYQWFLGLALICFILSEGLAFFLGSLGPDRSGFPLLLTAFFFMFAAPARAETFKGEISEGNRLYRAEKYDEALKRYESASEIRPGDPRADFNKGAARYRLKDWEAAKEEFQKSSLNKNKAFRSRSLYNLGNAHFEAGRYAEAVQSYQESLKLDPVDRDARDNLRLALEYVKNPPPKTKQDRQKEGKGDQKDKAREAQAQQDEKKENAKRTLKGASNEDGNKPIFKPQSKEKKNKEYEEDW